MNIFFCFKKLVIMNCPNYIIVVLILVSTQIVKYNCTFNKFYEDSVKRRMFFEVIDQFKTMEKDVTTISESDKKALLEKLDRRLPLTDIVSYKEKIIALGCGYGYVALNMLLHIKQMADNRSIRPKTVAQYSNYLHRILLNTYMLKVPTLRVTGFVAVYVDALRNGFDKFNDEMFIRTMNMFVGPLRACNKRKKTNRLLYELSEIHSTDFSYINTELLSNLRLSANSEGVLLNLFGSEDRFDVYWFFFSKKNINEKFAPPKVWFETYQNTDLKALYNKVNNTWKTNYLVLCEYTNTISNLVLMTSYYALLKHCRFMLITWYILVERVKLSEPSLRPSMREERKKLMQIPLPILEIIFRNLDSRISINFLPCIEANLNNDENATKTKFTEFVKQVLAMYNLYANDVGAINLSYEDWLSSFKIQNQFLYEDPNIPSFQTALMENVQILQSYYSDVIETLLPTDFSAIESLSSFNYLVNYL